MLLRIKWNPTNVVAIRDGEVFLKVEHFGPQAIAAHVVTTDGQTVEDFEANKGKSNKSVLIGTKGTITLESH